MAQLTTLQRKNIPKSKVGLPGNVTQKGGAVTGSYPMPDKKHAIVAKSFASRFASPSQKAKIDAKANTVIGRNAAIEANLKKRIGK